MTKKLRFFVLLMAMALLLAACGKQQTEDPAEQLPEETVQEKPAAEPELTLGKLDGLVYTNTYCGFALTLNEAWTVLPAEQAQDVGTAVVDQLQGSAVEEILEKHPQFMDLVASRASDLSGINVNYQALQDTEKALYINMTEEQIVDATLAASSAMIESYEQLGMSNVSMEKVTVEFMGQTRTAMKTSAEMYGMNYYVLQLFYYRGGSHVVTLTASAFNTDVTGELLQYFSPISQ